MNTKLTEGEHPEVIALEDAAWDLKGLAERFHARAMTEQTRAALGSALRDVRRVHRALEAELDRRIASRKRGAAEDTAAAEGSDELPGLPL